MDSKRLFFFMHHIWKQVLSIHTVQVLGFLASRPGNEARVSLVHNNCVMCTAQTTLIYQQALSHNSRTAGIPVLLELRGMTWTTRRLPLEEL